MKFLIVGSCIIDVKEWRSPVKFLWNCCGVFNCGVLHYRCFLCENCNKDLKVDFESLTDVIKAILISTSTVEFQKQKIRTRAGYTAIIS